MTTIEDAMAFGQGTERPCQCPVHEDHHDSASVNVAKGLWYCHACHAAGSADGGKPPSTAALLSLLQPVAEMRVYPDAYLEFFGPSAYWGSRFAPAVCWAGRLGEDPFTGHPVYPVYTPLGALAGLTHRRDDEEPKYKYPANWSASRSLGWAPNYSDVWADERPPLVLVEGYPDALALCEVGVPAAAVYGAGLHLPQRELLLSRGWSRPVLGFDNDKAGIWAAERTQQMMADLGQPLEVVEWPKKDPGEMSKDERLATLVSVVGDRYLETWSTAAARMTKEHTLEVERG